VCKKGLGADKRLVKKTCSIPFKLKMQFSACCQLRSQCCFAIWSSVFRITMRLLLSPLAELAALNPVDSSYCRQQQSKVDLHVCLLLTLTELRSRGRVGFVAKLRLVLLGACLMDFLDVEVNGGNQKFNPKLG
jgi:hypothetical protein